MKYIIALILSACFIGLRAQEFNMFSETDISFKSDYRFDTLQLHLAVPLVHSRSSHRSKFPLIILLDQQNMTTFNYNIRSINLLTGVGAQMPQSIVVGVPFDPEMRTSFTSRKVPEGDSLSGLESTRRMIVEELIPMLKERFGNIGQVLLFGHSRTGYLANYIATQSSEDFSVIVSCSGFYDDDIKADILRLSEAPREKEFSYYMTAGTGWEESTYREEFEAMQDALIGKGQTAMFEWNYLPVSSANHMTNYGLSVPRVLADHYRNYPELLNSWFNERGAQESGSTVGGILEADIKSRLGLTPQVLHIFSIASHYYQQSDYAATRSVLRMGLEYYPKELMIRVFEAEVYAAEGRIEESEMILREVEMGVMGVGYDEGEVGEVLEWVREIREMR